MWIESPDIEMFDEHEYEEKKPLQKRMIRMSLSEFIKEHLKLGKVLKSGSKKEREKMAEKQLAEIKKYKK